LGSKRLHAHALLCHLCARSVDMGTRKTKRPAPKPFPTFRPNPPGLESVFAEPLRTFGARHPGTLADQLDMLDMLAEEPVRIVQSLLAAPELLEWERVIRDNQAKSQNDKESRIAAAARRVIADLGE